MSMDVYPERYSWLQPTVSEKKSNMSWQCQLDEVEHIKKVVNQVCRFRSLGFSCVPIAEKVYRSEIEQLQQESASERHALTGLAALSGRPSESRMKLLNGVRARVTAIEASLLHSLQFRLEPFAPPFAWLLTQPCIANRLSEAVSSGAAGEDGRPLSGTIRGDATPHRGGGSVSSSTAVSPAGAPAVAAPLLPSMATGEKGGGAALPTAAVAVRGPGEGGVGGVTSDGAPAASQLREGSVLAVAGSGAAKAGESGARAGGAGDVVGVGGGSIRAAEGPGGRGSRRTLVPSIGVPSGAGTDGKADPPAFAASSSVGGALSPDGSSVAAPVVEVPTGRIIYVAQRMAFEVIAAAVVSVPDATQDDLGAAALVLACAYQMRCLCVTPHDVAACKRHRKRAASSQSASPALRPRSSPSGLTVGASPPSVAAPAASEPHVPAAARQALPPAAVSAVGAVGVGSLAASTTSLGGRGSVASGHPSPSRGIAGAGGGAVGAAKEPDAPRGALDVEVAEEAWHRRLDGDAPAPWGAPIAFQCDPITVHKLCAAMCAVWKARGRMRSTTSIYQEAAGLGPEPLAGAGGGGGSGAGGGSSTTRCGGS